MKITDLQTLDQNIIKFLAEHRGIDRAVKGKIYIPGSPCRPGP